jgi:predicted nucleic acid-binding protein
MPGVLLDTTILVDWLRGRRRSRPKSEEHAYNSRQAIQLIDYLIDKEIKIFMSCHTLKELLKYPKITKEEEHRINSMLPQFCKMLVTDDGVAAAAGLLSRQSVEYREYHIEDCYIAATAIIYNLPLYTRNEGDFKYVPHEKLKVVVPYQFKT